MSDRLRILCVVIILLSGATPVMAAIDHSEATHRSLADTRLTWPSWDEVFRVVTMQEYNTRIVLIGTLLLGITAGIVGTFMLLRRRSLVGDVVSHASLPGIAVAFLVMEMMEPGSGKSLPGLLTGAGIAGAAGVVSTTLIRRYTRIREDAALAIVLSVFFGLGVALFSVIQAIPTGSMAGLHHFIYGKAALMVAQDVREIAVAAAVVLIVCSVLFKEFTVLCFDEEYAAVQGWPVLMLDLLLMALVVVVSVIGLQSVGLLLVVALLIIPAAAARFWTDHLGRMTIASGVLGGLSAFSGVMLSALFQRLPAGAVIVLSGSAFFLISLLFGTRRGVVVRAMTFRRMRSRIGRHDLLRAFYERIETALPAEKPGDVLAMTSHGVSPRKLLEQRTWSRARLIKLLWAAERDGVLRTDSEGRYRLTERGAADARRVVRNHRLWEMFLINHADIAPSHVDRDADMIEHVLEPELIEELETLLSKEYPEITVPPSPHIIEPVV